MSPSTGHVVSCQRLSDDGLHNVLGFAWVLYER